MISQSPKFVLASVFVVVFLGCSRSVPIVKNGRSDWTIVYGSAERDKLAATDFQEIFEKATGAKLRIQGGGSREKGESEDGKIFFVGAEFADRQLEDEQTWVTAKDGNIVFAGGGVAGTCYAVYDFCEKYFGYRLYGMYPGAEIVRKVRNLAWDGKDISTKPAFTGYRISHKIPKAHNEAEARFFRRNRNNAGDRPVTDRILGAQHGLFLWVPSTEKGYGSTWLDKLIGTKWEPMFAQHPEYFSLDSKGKRTNRGQLCFANKDVRKLLIARFREFAAKKGPGVYMVGSNDSHNERYCWCDGCAKMMATYRTNGGPLWDFILELCASVADMKDVYVASLVYKGPEQTELAPTGVVFPENFVADLGFLNSYLPPSKMRDIRLEDGRVYNRLQSIRDWKSIAQHVAWWYYGGDMPIQTYRRMQVEMRELLAAGVDSIGACGTGGSFEFQDVGDYMFFQLMRDPEMDADAAVMDIFRHKYGAAAQLVFDYLKELETYAIDNWGNPNFSFGTEDKYEKIPLEGADIVRWQVYFERALELVRDDAQALANVKIARTGLDCWTIVWASRVRKDVPEFKLDTNAILTRAFAACDAAEKRGIVSAKGDFARRSLESMKYYAMLKTDAPPAELAKEDPTKVWLYLPEEPKNAYDAKSHALVKDPKAAAGVTIPVRKQDFAKNISVQLLDAAGKEWLKVHPIDAKAVSETEYRLVEFGVSRVPRTGMLVFGNAWGSAADIRTLDRFYDPSYHEKLFQFYASVRREGNDLLIDRIYLVDRGMPESGRPKPSEIQMKYLETEMMGIVHYGLNTYVDREWGFGDTPPAVLKPTALDPEQWVLAAKAGGLKRLVLVCKHHDGFCLFPSKLNSDYTIANTTWKDGKGDLVKEFRDACAKHGLEFGAYLSPWDRHQANYASAAYVDYFQGQWDELMANYGPISEIWLDGANGGDGWYGGARETRKLPSDARAYYRFDELLDKLSRKFPQAIAFGGGLRANCSIWCGNETGMNPETCWSVRDGAYVPNEADTPFRCGGWFWHPEDRPKSLAELVDVYFMTVGRNSVLDLGLAPNRDGVIGTDDVARLKEFGDYVRTFNATDFAADVKRTEVREGNRLTVSLKLPTAKAFNVVDLKEEISDGQTIGTWTAEAKVGGTWKLLAKGTTVGYRRMERFESVAVDEVRVIAEGEGREPSFKSVALRFAPHVKPEAKAQDFEQWRSPVKLTEPAPDIRVFDLLRRVTVDTLQYRPPKGRTEGVPDRFALYASVDGEAWHKVMTGEFGNLRANPVMQRLPMPDKVESRYFKIVALRALEGTPRWEGTLTEFFRRRKGAKPAVSQERKAVAGAIEASVREAALETKRLQDGLSDRCEITQYADRVRTVCGTNVWTDALQAALDEHEIVRIPAAAEAYYVDRSIVVPSNRRIEAAGATIRLLSGVRTLLLRNRNTRDGTLAPIPSGGRDTNIAIVGGRWEDSLEAHAGHERTGRYDPVVWEKGRWMGVMTLLFFNNCDHLTIRDVTFCHASRFAVQTGDGDSHVYQGIRFDRCFKDGLHLNGNLSRVWIKDVVGDVGDDLVALNAYDWLNSSVNFGPQRQILCEDLELRPRDGRSYPAIRIQPAKFRYADGSIVDCAISQVVFRRVKGIMTFKMYLQTPRYEIGTDPEWSAVGSGGDLYFEDIAIDLAGPLDRFPQYVTGDPVRGHFGAFEFGANLKGIHFRNINIHFHADRFPLSHLATVGPKSITNVIDGRRFEIFDPYVNCRVENVTLENVRTSGVVPKELVHTTAFEDINGDGHSSGRGMIVGFQNFGIAQAIDAENE